MKIDFKRKHIGLFFMFGWRRDSIFIKLKLFSGIWAIYFSRNGFVTETAMVKI